VKRTSTPRPDGEYITSLARGLSVLRAFTRDHPEMSLSEVAALTRLSPAAVRRCLRTLEHLGYVARNGKRFLLRPEVIAFASAYLESVNLVELVRPYLQEVRDRTGDSSSLAVLSRHDILYLLHVSTNRMVRLAAGVGTRFPAYATSMGRVLLAWQPPGMVDTYFEEVELRPLTDRTVTSPVRLKEILKDVRRSGYASVQDELDYGIVSLAVPVLDQDGTVLAAINCSTSTSRIGQEEMIATRLGPLREAARHIEDQIRRHPILAHSVGR
jgi:IclR family pca regulon transcriptional regulator